VTQPVVLIIAYHFPPENAIGGARPYRFYKYLSQIGYCCHVITAAEQVSGQNRDLEYVPDPFVERPGKGIGWQVERAIRKLLMPGVTGIRWSRLACRASRAFLRSNPNSEVTVFSTFPPLGTHLAAFQLKRRDKLKWIADFRDPLHSNPGNVGLRKFQDAIYRWLERALLRSADIVIANTDSMAEKWKSSYPEIRDRVHLIWNGFDPEDRLEPEPLPHRSPQIISHVGELYEGRSIAPLLAAFSRLISAGRLHANALRIRLVGPARADSLPGPEFLQQATSQGWLELTPHQVPHQEARSIAQESDGLLPVAHPSPFQVPAKLFEYLRLGRPILAYILPGSPVEYILKRSGVAYRCAYVGGSREDLDSTVENFLSLNSDGGLPNDWFRENFDAKRQTQTLDALIRSLHAAQEQI
jgi:glycosyltransferase involved in cell wall biosynthesis